MGNWFCRTQEMKVLILGLDGVGKTTLLYHMNLGEVIIPIPTIGYNHEILKIDGVSLTTWDVGSRDKFRPMWRHFYPGTRGIIFVIDCTDRERLGEAMEELCNVLNSEETKNSVFMVMANKQDLEDSMTAQEVEDELLRRFPFLTRLSQSIFVMPCSAFDKSQVMEAFSYFAHLILLNGAGKAKRSFITLKEQQAQRSDSNKTESWLALKLLLKDSVHYFKSFFEQPTTELSV